MKKWNVYLNFKDGNVSYQMFSMLSVPFVEITSIGTLGNTN